jgi:hypothetical protein
VRVHVLDGSKSYQGFTSLPVDHLMELTQQ